MAEVVAAAELTGPLDTHLVCVVSPAPHTESLSIDVTSALGSHFEFLFQPGVFDSSSESAWCPDPASTALTPLIELSSSAPSDSNPKVWFSNLEYLAAACAAGDRPLAVATDAGITFDSVRIRGVGGHGIQVSHPTLSGYSDFFYSRLEGVDGTALSVEGNFGLLDSEISGAVSVGAPLIEQLSPSHLLTIQSSAIFGNVVAGGEPLIRSTGNLEFRDSLVSGNDVLDHADLLEWQPPDAPELYALVVRTVFARNRLLGTGIPPAPAVLYRPIDTGNADTHCLPLGSDLLEYAGRDTPTVSAANSAQALIKLTGQQSSASSRAEFSLLKSYVAEHFLGDGAAVLRTSGSFGQPSLSILQSYVAALGEAPLPVADVDLIDGDGTTLAGLGTLISARNVFRGTPTSSLPTLFTHVETTFDIAESGTLEWYDQPSTLDGVVGPAGPDIDWSTALVDPVTLMGLDDCERTQLLCPNVTTGCPELSEGETTLCALDAAGMHIATAQTAVELALPWPWQGPLLDPTGDGDPVGSIGPWGLSCAFNDTPFDLGPASGDNDTFTTLTDCDNEDPLVTPALPTYNGFDTPECDTADGACYVCPYGETDDDGDGYGPFDDCDDTDASRNPGQIELCDAIDSDCDGSIVDEFSDLDLDLDPDCNDPDADGDLVNDPTDCDDLDATIYPDAPETCDDIDSDCDGSIVDEFSDLDLDLDPDCNDPDADGDLVEAPTDCDDLNPDIHPGAPETCDAIDSDCNGDLVDGEPDYNTDGQPDCIDPPPVGDDDDSSVGDDDDSALDDDDSALDDDDSALDDDDSALDDDDSALDDDDSAATDDDDSAVTDDDDTPADDDDLAIDDDDSAITDDDDSADPDPDGDNDGSPESLDCDDSNPAAFPGAIEVCDTVDNDCDGDVLESYIDTDGDLNPDCTDNDDDNDGFFDGFDCAPLDVDTYVGAEELCDAVDNDCDGDVLESWPDTDGDLDPDCTDLDDDNDGEPDVTDCDSLDPDINPSETELCDGIDTNCDSTLLPGELDDDGDGFRGCEGDCDDDDPDANPDATELCDGIDTDCDGTDPSDEADMDDDGVRLCDGDCDDDDPSRYPGATELCNGLDEDCNPSNDSAENDDDGDGSRQCEGDCDDSNPDQSPNHPELCNGFDDDCDMSTNETTDGDGDGQSLCDGDCDDSNAMVFEGAEEICDGLDNDCDPVTDEAADADGDGFALCDGDCDDGASIRYPDAPEECNGRDDDCDGAPDEDEVDQDEDLWRVCNGDCDDMDPALHPSAQETCDGIDQDCDGDLLETFDDHDADGIPTCIDSEERIFEVGPDGCSAPEGCGFSWDPRAALLFFPLGLLRRRR